MKKLKHLLFVSVLTGSTLLALSAASPSLVSADTATDNLCGGAELSLDTSNANECDAKDRNGDGKPDSDSSRIEGVVSAIVNVLSAIVGVVAVIMLILGGFNYITSGGDSGKISSAKNTIIYAIVGLIIVALAQVIVRFVLGKV